MHVDFGTGDGAYVRRMARLTPDRFFLGLDAVAGNLGEASRLAARKPERGGLPNALFGRLSLEQAPGELAGLADHLTVLLPWGSLLRAVARPEADGLARLCALCKPGASLEFLFGYDRAVDGAAVEALELLPLQEERLARAYRDLGFEVTVRPQTTPGLRQLPTTWAQKLTRGARRPGADRRFVLVLGKVASLPRSVR